MSLSEEQEHMDMTKQQLKMMDWAPFLESNRLKQFILHTKKTHHKFYCSKKSVFMNQLNHALAVESGENEKSPYSDENYSLYRGIINTLAGKLRRKDYQISDKETSIKITKLLELQLMHVDAMTAKTYNLSPYFQRDNDRVKQVHESLTIEIINAAIDELESMFDKVDIFDLSFVYTPLGEHMLTLLLLHEFLGEEVQDLTDISISDREYSDTDSELESEEGSTESWLELKTRREDIQDNNSNERENNVNKEKMDVEKFKKEETAQLPASEKEELKTLAVQKIKMETQQKIIEEQNLQIKKLENQLTLQNEHIKHMQNLIKNYEENETKSIIELEDKIAILRQENNNLENDRKQLMDRLDKTKLIIETKQQEIKNKTEKIENLRKELLQITKQQDNRKIRKEKGITTTELTYENKRTQTIDNRENVETQTEFIGIEAQAGGGAVSALELSESPINKQLQKEFNNTQAIILNESNILRDPAILIKCKNSSQVSSVQELLNETENSQRMMISTHIKLAKNKRTLIIKASTEEVLKTLHQNLINNAKLTEQAEINYKQSKTYRLIITGIPINYNKTQIIQCINNYYKFQKMDETSIIKIKNSKSSKYYQMIIDTESYLTSILLKEGFLLVGTRRCRVTAYRPVIRCSNCQLYGHGAHSCTRLSICAYCAQGHHTNACPNTSIPELKNCTNCLERLGYVPHTADSSCCLVYGEQLLQRNNLTNSFINSFMNSYTDYYTNSNTNSYIDSSINMNISGLNSYNSCCGSQAGPVLVPNAVY